MNQSLNILEEKIQIGGIFIHKIGMAKLLEYCNMAILNRKKLVLGMVNVAKLVNSRKDELLRNSLIESDLVAADGQGIVMMSKWAGKALPERVAGVDVMLKLMEQANVNGNRIYFLGAKPEVLTKVIEKTEEVFPNIVIAGYTDGYFDLDQDGYKIACRVRDSRADILFVAISPPKKEIFIKRWSGLMDVPVCHGVGGSFDIFAGVTKRAPGWMQRSGLEWFYRILQEPKRMWKRYLITNSIFFIMSIKEIFSSRIKRSV